MLSTIPGFGEVGYRVIKKRFKHNMMPFNRTVVTMLTKEKYILSMESILQDPCCTEVVVSYKEPGIQ